MQPGGKIEAGESALDGPHPRTREEIGFVVDPGETEYIGIFRAVAANEAEHGAARRGFFAITVAGDIEAQARDRGAALDRAPRQVPVELAPLTRDALLPLWARAVRRCFCLANAKRATRASRSPSSRRKR